MKQTKQTINKTNPIDPTSQTGRIRSIASIDALAEYAVNELSACPSFFHKYERAFNEKVLDYGLNLIDECSEYEESFMPDEIAGSDESDEMLSAIYTARNDAEETIGDVLDAAVELNMKYFQAGLRFGAMLIMQLLY